MFRLFIAFVLLSAFTSAVPAPARAGDLNNYVELFDSDTWRDPAATTTTWFNAVRLPVSVKRGARPTFEPTFGVAVSGHYAYLAADNGGVLIVDVADPVNPTLVDSLYTGEQIREVQIRGNHLYFANIFDGMGVIDITDPLNASIVSMFNTTGQTVSIDVEGDYAYLADGPVELSIVDVTDPIHPTLAGTYNPAAYAQHVRVAGGYAFVADWSNGLRVFDVSDPTTPMPVGSYDTPGLARFVALQGTDVYLADNDGLYIFDCSDPTSPSLIGTYMTPGLARGVTLDGHFAYVSDHADGTHLLDISNPASPLLLGTIPTDELAHGFTVHGTSGFSADGFGGVVTLDIASWPAVSEPAGIQAASGTTWSASALSGRRLFLARDAGGVDAVDITDPSLPSPPVTIAMPGTHVFDVAVDGRRLYATGDTGAQLRVYDVSDPAAPDSIGGVALDSIGGAVAVDGNLVFVESVDTMGTAHFNIVDCADPGAPVLLHEESVASRIQEFAVDGDQLFVLSEDNFAVRDLTDPTTAPVVGQIGITGSTHLIVDGDLAVVTGGGWVYLVDVSDVTSPVTYPSIFLGGSTGRAALAGDLLFVPFTLGILTYDVTDPSQPVPVFNVPGGGPARAVHLFGNYAIAADSAGVETHRVLNRAIDSASNVAASIDLNSGGEVLRARIVAGSSGANTFSLTADGGAMWQTAPIDNTWQEIVSPGADLRWRVELDGYGYALGEPTPAVTQVNMDWLFAYPCIDLIADVPGDEGVSLQLAWQRSGHDFAGDAEPVASYTVYAKFEGPASSWDSVTTVSATQSDYYGVVAPASNSQATYYRIAANTTLATYISPPDSGTAIDEIAPDPPVNVSVAYNQLGNNVAWEPPASPDVVLYSVHRGSGPNFVPVPGNHVATVSALSWTDDDANPGWYYRVTAADAQGNVSTSALATITTGAGGDAVPRQFALHPNYPNPFNPGTTIAFDVPNPGGRIDIRIYDVSGRLVRTLYDGHAGAGAHRITWDGRNNTGGRVASGVYFCRMTTGENHNFTRKLTLIE